MRCSMVRISVFTPSIILAAAVSKPSTVLGFVVVLKRGCDRLPRTLPIHARRPTKRSHCRPCLLANMASDKDTSTTDAEMEILERQVLESARATVDVNRVLKALETDVGPSQRIDGMYENERTVPATSHLQIAIAASLVTGVGSFLVLHSLYVSLIVAGFCFLAAFLDQDDTLAGALARILGRTTLQSVQASQPRVKALARAVVTGEEEIGLLQRRIQALMAENEKLRQWKEQRIQLDEALSKFKVEELRSIAREKGLVAKGTKADLLVRLVESGAIDLDG